MTTHATGEADAVVLIHGLWTTPRIWEHWIPRIERHHLRVVAPAYPGLEGEVEALNADPSPIAALTVPATVEHLEQAIAELPTSPVLIGHGFGGALVQILLDRGVGIAGVAINSVPTEGVRAMPAAAIRSAFPVLHNPANRHRAVGFSAKHFHRAFANTLDEAAADEAYRRYVVPAPGRFVWDGVLANIKPGHQDTWVDYRNPDRAPLLLLSGGMDQIVPASVVKENAHRYDKSPAHTDYKEFENRDHFTIGAPDWEQVWGYAYSWLSDHRPWIRHVMEARESAS
jgi:alpha-beta hydrolase superfamily lysophospholipase